MSQWTQMAKFRNQAYKISTEVLDTHFFAYSEREGCISKSNYELVLHGCLKGDGWGVAKTLKFKKGVRIELSDPNQNTSLSKCPNWIMSLPNHLFPS